MIILILCIFVVYDLIYLWILEVNIFKVICECVLFDLVFFDKLCKLLDVFDNFNKFDFLFKIFNICLVVLLVFFIINGIKVGLILLEWVFIVILVSGVKFIDVLIDLLLLIVVIDVLLLMWYEIICKFLIGLFNIFVVFCDINLWFVLWKLYLWML